MVLRLLWLPALTWPTVFRLFLDTLWGDSVLLAVFWRLVEQRLWVFEMLEQMRLLKR